MINNFDKFKFEWKEWEFYYDIPWYEWLYQASILWNIKSLSRNITFCRWNKYISKEKILKEDINRNGYHMITLTKNWKSNRIVIHRLIALMFVPNIEGKPQVNHKDGDKNNNNVSNLERCTASENIKHSFNNLWKKAPSWKNHWLYWKHWKEHPAIWKKWWEALNARKIQQYSLKNELIKEYCSITWAANELNIWKQNISECCRLQQKTAWWFIFKYKKW